MFTLSELPRWRTQWLGRISSRLLKSVLGTNYLKLVWDTFLSIKRLKVFFKARAYLIKAR